MPPSLRLLPLLAFAACGGSMQGQVGQGQVGETARAARAASPIMPARTEAAASRASPVRPQALLPGLGAARIEPVEDGLILYGVTLPSEAGTLTASELRLEGLVGTRDALTAARLTGRDVEIARAGGTRVRLASLTVSNLALPNACAAGTTPLARLACARWDLLAATDAEAEAGASR